MTSVPISTNSNSASFRSRTVTMAQDTYAQLTTSTVLSGLGQHLVTLSDANKTSLLFEATGGTTSDEGQARAETLLSRLRELNPNVARQFHPKQHALSDLSLRMICAAPQSPAESTAVNKVATYIAVSYCWHYPQWPIAPAATPICDAWKISRPMMDAVMALRQSSNEGVWLDQLCINQSDGADIAAHIGVMDAIYNSARRIAILLEDVQLEIDEEEAGLAYAGFYEDLCRDIKEGGLEGEEKSRFIDEYFPRRAEGFRNSGKGHILAAAKPFAKKILGARWYSRAWCAHESRMTKHAKVNNPLFMCFGANGGVLQFEFRFIHYLGLHLSDSEPADSLVGNEFMEKINDPVPESLRQLWWRIQRLMPNPSADVSAMQHLVSILSFGCVKKRDLLSIALNTAGIPLCFDGENIQFVEEVIWKFSLLVLASGDLVPLVTIGKSLRIPTDGREVISWAINPAQGVLEEPLSNPLPESITAITQEYIELDLIIFESLPRQASVESQAKATGLIAEHNLNAIGEELLPTLSETTQSTINLVMGEMTRLKPNAHLLQHFQHLLLSLALDNGLDWILNFPSAMLQATSPAGWLHGPVGASTNPALTAAAHSLLSLFPDTNPATNPQSDASNTTTPMATTTPLLQHATHALTTLLDPRLLLLTPNPRRLPLPPTQGFAALTAAASNKSYIAVPAALAHLPGRHARAWAVEPFDPVAAASRPEEVGDLLPAADLRVAGEGETEDRVEDVVPVLSSDYADRRAAREDVRGTWRVRRTQVLFGCLGGVWDGAPGPEGEGGAEGVEGGEGLVLLRRQRVYGCEDYPWGVIHAALRRVFGDGQKADGLAGVAN